MAQDRGGQQKTSEFLGGITSYSGSDIEVIAFRDTSTLNFLKLDSIGKEKKEIEDRQSELRRELSQTRTRQLIQSRGGDTDGLVYIDPATINLPGNETLNPSADRFGKSPNQIDTVALNNSRAVQDIISEQRQQSERFKELDDEERSIRGALSLNPLGTVHTVSYSSFREKFAVRTLGKVQAKAYTQGTRTIAGTMVFNVMQQHELMRIAVDNEDTESFDPRAILLDQIKPFNLMFIFSNEFGSYSIMILFDVTIQSEGQEMSVENIITMNTMNFYATDIVPMTPIGNLFNTYDEMLAKVISDAGGTPVTKSDKARYRSISRLENLANSKASRSLSDEIDTMLAESRSLF
jgi:hypothetical protein